MNRSIRQARGPLALAIDRTLGVFALPIVGAAAAVLGVVTGFWGSLHNQAVSKALPFPFTRTLLADWPAVDLHVRQFWLLLLAFGAVLMLHQWAVARRTRVAQAALARQTEDLQGLVERFHTLPPDGWVEEFDSTYGRSYAAALLAFSERRVSDEELAGAIRAVLFGMLGLAWRYDRSPQRVVYAASIMVFRDEVELRAMTPAQREALTGRLVFHREVGGGLDAVRGVLELLSELSTSTDPQRPPLGGRASPDRPPRIVLPVARELDAETARGRRYKVLPGAPWAVATRRYASFVNLQSMLDWCENQGDFTEETKHQIRAFFAPGGPGAAAQSFVSVPLLTPKLDPQAPDPPCLGVVNIQRSEPGILRGDGHALFVNLMAPFFALLVQLLIAHRAAATVTAAEKPV